MNKLVSINILTYNAQDLIELCLESVLKQNYANIEILIIDNASSDNTLRQITKHRKQNAKFPMRVIENKKNLGFTAGHNQGIRKSNGEYVLCLNQDIILDKNFVKNAVKTMELDKKIGAIQGKLYKITRDMWEIESPMSKQGVLDSTGLLIFKNRRIVSRGQGEKDEDQYKRGEVFGVDGAAPLYRRKALEDIKINNEYFDEDFFMYKEDIDLAWRMRLYRWKSIYEPGAIGYHLRSAGEGAVKKYLKVAKARKKISDFAKFYSFKNQRLMQIKNELPTLFFRHFYRIIIKEAVAWIYVLFFERYTWKAIKLLIKQAPIAWRKRKIIMTHKRVNARNMEKWFV